MKTCTKCGTPQAVSAFYKDSSKKDGLHPVCAMCQKAYTKHKRATDKEWRAACLKRSKKYREKYPDRVKFSIRNATLKKKYGIGIEEYEVLLTSQEGVCAICGREDNGINEHNFHIDHCHTTGKIRGLLCQPCNTGLGKFNDDPKLLAKALVYLKAGE